MIRTTRTRRGAVLLLVLVMVPILALGAYAFTHWMRAEARGASVQAKRMQARWLADSGIEWTRALLADPANLLPGGVDLENNTAQFAGQPVYQENNQQTSGRFSLVAPLEDGTDRAIRFGIVHESAKIPLHRRLDKKDRAMLMGLPNMTEDIADAILDWCDKDDTPRDLGAESSHYLSLTPPYEPRNGRPLSIGELLLVRGVTPSLLYGEDINLDGILNPNENDGDASWPPDNADGVLDRGWYPYLTLHSASANTNSAGEPKVNLNDQDQDAVQAKLTELFGEELATFFQAYRTQKKKIKAVTELIDASIEIDAPSPPGGVPGLPGGGGGGGRGGGRGRKIKLESPWKSDSLEQFLPTALDQLTVVKQSVLKGRIDILRAPAPVLQSLPGMTAEAANNIAAAAMQRSLSEPSAAWLLTDGLVSLQDFQKIEPEITTTGRVFRCESVGFLDSGGPVVRIEAIFDASGAIPRVIERQDLTPLGNFYTRQMLTGATRESTTN
ncbi:MAG: type II secretion system protein GspK [Planctomycetota bacterium]